MSQQNIFGLNKSIHSYLNQRIEIESQLGEGKLLRFGKLRKASIIHDMLSFVLHIEVLYKKLIIKPVPSEQIQTIRVLEEDLDLITQLTQQYNCSLNILLVNVLQPYNEFIISIDQKRRLS